MTLSFGVHAGLQLTTISELQQLWRKIEDDGFDWISIWDHFYAADPIGGGSECLEAVATHAALAAATVPVPANPPSTQPVSATSMTGSRSSGH